MIPRVIGWLAIVWTAALGAAGPQQPSTAGQPSTGSPAAPVAAERTLVNRYCVGCHNAKLKTGGLTLDTIDMNKVSENAPVWEKVVRKLRVRAMPPGGRPRPDEAGYEALVSY